MWSGANQQYEVIPWTLVTAGNAGAFATTINGVNRPSPYNLTAPQNALQYAANNLNNNFEASRQVIDISGDGARNDGLTGAVGRNAALAAGYDTINGLVILGETGLVPYYTNFVIGGTNAFLESISDFSAFAVAIERKLEKEVSPIPEPVSMLLFGTGLIGVGGYVRKKLKNK
jgi:hypothetical protein